MMRMTRPGNPLLLAATLALAHFAPVPASAQDAGASTKGRLERVRVHGASLEGNLSGDSPERDVTVCLPPGYDSEPDRRYPVIYMLHGYTDSDERWMGLRQSWISLSAVLDSTFADGGVREMIVVMPNSYTRFQGSMYSNSITTGYWEDFITRDLIAWVDTHYRTIPDRDARGLAGHSMGGYGTMRIGMKQPAAFAALYAMSSCCLMNDPAARGAGPGPRGDNAAARGAGAGRGDGRGAGAGRGGGMANALSAQAAAWAPNTKMPPYFDLPTKDGEIQPLIAAKWIANSPLVMVDQYVPALKSMRAIAIDVGNKDPFVSTNTQLAESLTRLGITHTFEVYDGDHGNRIRERFESQVLRFFSQHLSAR